ncbi:lipoprotein [Lacrimispora brassicae]
MKHLKKLTVMQKRELILIAAILAISGLLSAVFYAGNRKAAELVVVTVDGKTVATLDLHKDTDMIIDGHGGTDHLVIKDGYASITEATCPDKVCVRTGRIHKSGELIVCLPNRVVVTIEGGE